MKTTLVLLAAALLSSCVHTAIAPVATPDGVPIVIRVPGARAGQKTTREQISAMESKILKGMIGNSAPAKPDPAIVGIGTIGKVGDVTTKRGERFIGYAPFIVVRSTYPEEVVDRAAGLTAAAYYRGAKKHFQVTPVTELVAPAQKKKP